MIDLTEYVTKSMEAINMPPDQLADPRSFLEDMNKKDVKVDDVITGPDGDLVWITDVEVTGDVIKVDGLDLQEAKATSFELPDKVTRMSLAPGEEMIASLRLTGEEIKQKHIEMDEEWLRSKTVAPAPCSLDFHVGASNWVQRSPWHSLPNYICQVASALVRKGRPVGSAIGIAVGAMNMWCAGKVNVHPTTRARACAAAAEWKAMVAWAKATHGGQGLPPGPDKPPILGPYPEIPGS